MLKPFSQLCLLVLVSFGVKTSATEALPPLPEPVTNNAVAKVVLDGKTHLFSFMGLGAGKGVKDVHNKAWQLTLSEDGKTEGWQAIVSVPSRSKLKGRLASIAVGMDKSVYIFGGYTVANDHSEVSEPDVYAYHIPSKTYRLLASMPVPVDDAVALPYKDRYIYLVSGWHNDGNVNLVQVYDVIKNEWFQASPFLGKPVFGHAGGIVDNQIMVCDGVTTKAQMLTRRTFEAETACYLGEIDFTNPARINWYQWVHPTDESRYRMAAIGDVDNGRILFVGGSNNPYNYDGIGYNNKPSAPSNEIWEYQLEGRSWKIKESPIATMDHRGLILVGDKWITIGGMKANQEVTADVTLHKAK